MKKKKKAVSSSVSTTMIDCHYRSLWLIQFDQLMTPELSRQN